MTTGNYNGFPTQELSAMHDDISRKMKSLEQDIIDFGEKMKEQGFLNPNLKVHTNIAIGYFGFNSITPDDYWWDSENILYDLSDPSSVNEDYRLFVEECKDDPL